MQEQGNKNITKSQPNTYRIISGWKYGDFVDAVYTSIPPSRERKYLPLNEKEYVVLSTGEIKEFQETENTKSKHCILQAMHTLRRIISGNYNPENKLKTLFVTLTYAENMTDPDKLYTDFKEFIRLLRKYAGQNIEYICVREPQERGAWHCHAMLIGEKNIYVKPDDLRRFWPHGRCKAERVKDVNSAGAYLCAYFCNTEKGAKKMGRIGLYPKNFKFYTTSKGIKKPVKIETTLHELNEAGNEIHRKEFDIKLPESEMVNSILKVTYKLSTLPERI